MKELKGITRKQLKTETGVPGYIIDYLHDCIRLPVVHESEGRGYQILYHPDAIQVVKDHVNKQRLND